MRVFTLPMGAESACASDTAMPCHSLSRLSSYQRLTRA